MSAQETSKKRRFKVKFEEIGTWGDPKGKVGKRTAYGIIFGDICPQVGETWECEDVYHNNTTMICRPIQLSEAE